MRPHLLTPDRQMRLLLMPVGSAGDVHPFVGLGVALQARGHDVTIVTSPHFESVIRAAGLSLRPWGTVEQFDELTKQPDLWHHNRGAEVIAEALRLGMPELYQIVVDESRKAPTVVVAHGLAFAARLAHDTIGVPLVTIHLQPASIYSVHDTPVLHPWLGSINRCPMVLKRGLLRVIDRGGDHMFARAINGLRAEHDLPPVRHITSRWWHSPQRVIGLFPEWFAAPQPDWPPQTALTGFPLFDGAPDTPLPPEVERFVAEGPPPLVFLPGSANRHADRFFAAATQACRLLDRRGILLTPYREQVPPRLPEQVRHFDYVPLGRLLPRAAALVHHGGIGTAAQGLAAGVPQVLMPMTFDQPDNANRLGRLGVARTVWPRAFKGPAVARALKELLGSSRVKKQCVAVADRLRGEDPIGHTCELIEAQAGN